MTDHREVMWQALDELLDVQKHYAYTQGVPTAIETLRAALAEKVDERGPMTDAELEHLYDRYAKYQEYGAWASGWFEFARAIEAAHGIKETK
jgi:hypothetical protein